MPNIASVLKVEISRLSRREVRKQIEATVKASAQHRRYIAALRRQVAKLERELAQVQRRVSPGSAAAPNGTSTTPLRFVAKGFRSQRARLGLSATQCGKLLGVSAQSIYNWEREVSAPGKEQLQRIAAFRELGKREAHTRLAQINE